MNNVIAVCAARASFEDGRGIHMSDAKSLQIRNNPLRISQSEPLMKLQPVSGKRTALSLGRDQAIKTLTDRMGIQYQSLW
jgi:hypothetical protein